MLMVVLPRYFTMSQEAMNSVPISSLTTSSLLLSIDINGQKPPKEHRQGVEEHPEQNCSCAPPCICFWAWTTQHTLWGENRHCHVGNRPQPEESEVHLLPSPAPVLTRAACGTKANNLLSHMATMHSDDMSWFCCSRGYAGSITV